MRTLKTITVLLIILTLALPAPVFSDVGIEEEAEMGREFDKEVRAHLPIVEDPYITDYCRDVVAHLVETIPPQPFRMKTAVIRNGSMNAFAVPGGYVYVFTGLITGLTSEAQLAAVLGHELAHVTQHHVVDRMEDMESWSIASLLGTLAGIALAAAGGGSSAKNAGQALAMGSRAAAVSAFLEYTRENEVEADHVGLSYLVAAGYNPEAMPQTFEHMAKSIWTTSSTSGKMPSYMRTHPFLSERVGYLRDRIKGMDPALTKRVTDDTRFHHVQSLIRGRFQDAKIAVAHYENMDPATLDALDHMGLGMAYQRLNMVAQARTAFENGLREAPDDQLLLRESGRFFFKQGEYDRAEPLLKRAMIMAPQDAVTLFYNARLLGERGRYEEALPAMKRVLKQVPGDYEVHYFMGRLYGESGDLFRAHVHLAYSAVYSGDSQKAMFHHDKALKFIRTDEDKAEMGKLEDVLKAKVQ